ncbi:MAG: hypothetical protein D6729_16685 [Deltaproteobacteria bacterium]|nr:MAG: hypothetical protein D6729_16685 [Deltaproteobacteria bacterium]
MSAAAGAVLTADGRVRIERARGPFAHASPVTPPEACEACGGQGRVVVTRDGVDFVRQCACRTLAHRCELFNAARIPRILADRTLDPSRAPASGQGVFAPNHPSQAEAVQRVRRFLSEFGGAEGDASGRGFLLMGKPGVGKSHLLVAAVRELTLERGVPCRYVEFFHLLSELRDGYSQGRSEQEIIGPLCEVEVLAVDELGKGRGTDWEMYVLDEVISRRYNAGKSTLFATNYTTDRDTTLQAKVAGVTGYVSTRDRRFIDQMTQETLEERVGVRIYSRLCDMCEFIFVDGEDYRRRHRERASG